MGFVDDALWRDYVADYQITERLERLSWPPALSYTLTCVARALAPYLDWLASEHPEGEDVVDRAVAAVWGWIGSSGASEWQRIADRLAEYAPDDDDDPTVTYGVSSAASALAYVIRAVRSHSIEDIDEALADSFDALAEVDVFARVSKLEAIALGDLTPMAEGSAVVQVELRTRLRDLDAMEQTQQPLPQTPLPRGRREAHEDAFRRAHSRPPILQPARAPSPDELGHAPDRAADAFVVRLASLSDAAWQEVERVWNGPYHGHGYDGPYARLARSVCDGVVMPVRLTSKRTGAVAPLPRLENTSAAGTMAAHNALLALTVRDLITEEQFHLLYAPFDRAIPLTDLIAQ